MSTFEVLCADCYEYLKELDSDTIDAVITDPPYGLGNVKDIKGLLIDWVSGFSGEEHVGSGGFMGKEWDKMVPPPSIWKEVLRVLKPGGHLLVFAGTRTQDLMGISIRLAGFELRDEISYLGNLHWMFGTGFPKGSNISKAIDKESGRSPVVVGYDASRARPNRRYKSGATGNIGGRDTDSICDRSDNGATITSPVTEAAKQWEGWSTALKPAHEPILVFRKVLEGTVSQNVQKYGTGGINVDACRIKTKVRPAVQNSIGRWSANVIIGHSEDCKYLEEKEDWECSGDCSVRELDAQSGQLKSGDLDRSKIVAANQKFGARPKHLSGEYKADSGGASRFFYCAKSSKSERNLGLSKDSVNSHPTVKPVEVMAWLCRLITPPGGVVLDPFCGTGSTGIAARIEGFDFIGIDKEVEYVEIAKKRIESFELYSDTLQKKKDKKDKPKAKVRKKSKKKEGKKGVQILLNF